MHERSSFLTLTYKDSSLPPDGSLRLADWQDFAKRVRHRNGKFRFFHCGEYGTKSGRCHLHALIFGLDWRYDRVFVKCAKGGEELFASATLAELWPHGLHFLGEVTMESAAYVARYLMSKQHGEQADRRYGVRVDKTTGEVNYILKPEYTTMSRNPGIGDSWIRKYMSDVYPSDEVICKGVRCKPPKFYDQVHEEVDPKGHQKVKALRAKRGKTEKNVWNHTYDRLAVRARVRAARMAHFTREL